MLTCDGSVEGAVDELLASVNPLIEELDAKVVESGLLQEVSSREPAPTSDHTSHY